MAQVTLQKKLSFDRALEVSDVSRFLFGNESHCSIITPVVGSGGRAFILATHDVATVMQLPPAVRNAIIQGGIITSTGKAWDFPGWLPKNIQDDIVSGKVARGVTHYKGSGGWGDIVVWKNDASVQFYQEFPESLEYYQRISSSKRTARLLHFAYTQWNKDIRHLVEDNGMSPEDARGELRRINDEVFKLVLEGAVAMLTTGVGISQVNNAMRFNADRVASVTRRSARFAESDEAEALEAEEAASSTKLQGSKPNVHNFIDDAQLGKKFGEHMDPDLPGYRSPGEYKQLAKDIYSDPSSVRTTFPDNAPIYPGETHIVRGKDLLRLDPDGQFRSLYQP